MTAALQLIGMTFERLTVERVSPRGGAKGIYWRCRCRCGKSVVVSGYDLRCGKTKSCGCYKRELMRVANLQHGGSGTRTHNIWRDMLRRCHDAKRDAFKHYGGRGITVCRRWLRFENFLADIARRLQGRNRRITIRVHGIPLATLCEQKGLRYGLVYDRIKRLGWSPKEALGIRGPGGR